MDCLRIILKDYKNEIDDILVADKLLQKELIYDMQKYESAKTDHAAQAAAAATARSVLKEAHTNTPPLSSMSVPKLKTTQGGSHARESHARNDRPLDILESLRSRKAFDSDDDN